VSWFRAHGTQANPLTGNKKGQFDLEFTGNLTSKVVSFRIADVSVKSDIAIDAYWCPFISGGGLPGWVDLPLEKPAYKFMFTAAMQGCALVVTTSPTPKHIRVYHHQHPEKISKYSASPQIWKAIEEVGQKQVSILDYEKYSVKGQTNVTNAFNFLAYKNERWSYVTQSHFIENLIGPKGTADSVKLTRNLGYGNKGVSIKAVSE
jgi:hypothetical protein